jgi:hypothetical protein
MAIAAVCQPLAASPLKTLAWAVVSSRWLRIELGCEVLDRCLLHDVGSRPESLADVEIFEV